ncbi:MAG: hypothetical protein IMY71_11040 [Bacteroidetes bacterium]|nr:hypothetical protein [Bacteroidota bacterium]
MLILLIATTFSMGDFGLTQDKVSHFSLGFTVGSLVYAEQIWENEEGWQRRVAFSMLIVATVAFAKEDYDLHRGGGEASLWDAIWTLGGGVVGNWVSNWLFNKGKGDKIKWEEGKLHLWSPHYPQWYYPYWKAMPDTIFEFKSDKWLELYGG